MSARKNLGDYRGFTLIEVMVAAAIASIVLMSLVQFTSNLVKRQTSIESKAAFLDMTQRVKHVVINRAPASNFATDACTLMGVFNTQVVQLPPPNPTSSDDPKYRLQDATGAKLNFVMLPGVQHPVLPQEPPQRILSEWPSDANQFVISGGPSTSNTDLKNYADEVEIRAVPDSGAVNQFSLEAYVKKYKKHGKKNQSLGTGIQYMEEQIPLCLTITTTDPALGTPTVIACDPGCSAPPPGPTGGPSPSPTPSGFPITAVENQWDAGTVTFGGAPRAPDMSYPYPEQANPAPIPVTFAKPFATPPVVIPFYNSYRYTANCSAGSHRAQFIVAAENITGNGFNFRVGGVDASCGGRWRANGVLGWIAVGQGQPGFVNDKYLMTGVVPGSANWNQTYTRDVVFPTAFPETPTTIFVAPAQMRSTSGCGDNAGYGAQLKVVQGTESPTGFRLSFKGFGNGYLSGGCGESAYEEIRWVAVGKFPTAVKQYMDAQKYNLSPTASGNQQAIVFFNFPFPTTPQLLTTGGTWNFPQVDTRGAQWGTIPGSTGYSGTSYIARGNGTIGQSESYWLALYEEPIPPSP